jgi:hypothetical protein
MAYRARYRTDPRPRQRASGVPIERIASLLRCHGRPAVETVGALTFGSRSIRRILTTASAAGIIMATRSDVRKIALSLPDTRQKEGHFAFEVRNGAKYKGFAWVWMQRIDPRKPRVACPGVIAIRVANLDAKEILLMADDRKFFNEPHYDGFPAVLVNLKEIGRAELRLLLTDAWATQAPKALLAKRRQ